MQWIRDYKPQPDQDRQYRLALGITIAGNLLLALGKAVVAMISGSAAIFADAANSISDVLYSLLMVMGLRVSQKPPDLTHPQGHARFEPVVGLFVTASMAYAGYHAANNAVASLRSGGHSVELGLPILVLVLAAGIKFAMYRVIARIARFVGSPALATSAQDNLSDVVTSLAAFVGVVGSSLIHPLLDPIAGLLVAVWIFRTVYNTAREHFGYLTGVGASPELRQKIVAIAEAVPGVLRVHHTMTEYVGPRLVVDLHINVKGSTTVYEAHAISDQVSEQVEKLADVDRAYVHIEPDDWV